MSESSRERDRKRAAVMVSMLVPAYQMQDAAAIATAAGEALGDPEAVSVGIAATMLRGMEAHGLVDRQPYLGRDDGSEWWSLTDAGLVAAQVMRGLMGDGTEPPPTPHELAEMADLLQEAVSVNRKPMMRGVMRRAVELLRRIAQGGEDLRQGLEEAAAAHGQEVQNVALLWNGSEFVAVFEAAASAWGVGRGADPIAACRELAALDHNDTAGGGGEDE